MSRGLYKNCKWWQIEPAANVTATTMGQCIEKRFRGSRYVFLAIAGVIDSFQVRRLAANVPVKIPPTAKPTR